jgi:hypothetical protein
MRIRIGLMPNEVTLGKIFDFDDIGHSPTVHFELDP